jgi:micrococcal nuclease
MYEYNAIVTRVIDGDTVIAEVDVGFNVKTSQHFRLVDINCPEVHGPSKAQGLAAAAYTRDHLLGRTVRLQSAKSDDFGRWLARIFVGDVDFNKQIVADGFAVPFMVARSTRPPDAKDD